MENNLESSASSSLVALKYGLISGLLHFLFSILTNVMGWAEEFQELIGWISGIWTLLITVTMTFLCLREFRAQNKGFIGYGEGLGLSSLLGALSGLASGAFNYVYIEFIDNGLLQRQIELVRLRMEDQGLSESEIKNSLKIFEMMLDPRIQFIGLVFSSLLFFFLAGLIVSAVVKREKSIFE